MQVREWMSTDLVTVTPSRQVAEARQLMQEYGIRHLPVVGEDGRLVGIVSDRDVRISEAALHRVLASRRAVDQTVLDAAAGDERSVGMIMSDQPEVIGEDEPVEAAAWLMLSRRISALPVVDADLRLVGLITTTDCLLASLAPEAERGFSGTPR